MLANQIYGLSQLCPNDYLIEDALLEFGIPYSENEHRKLVINLPEYFTNDFKKDCKIFQKKKYLLTLSILLNEKATLDKFEIRSVVSYTFAIS